jgi:hypothetical protein
MVEIRVELLKTFVVFHFNERRQILVPWSNEPDEIDLEIDPEVFRNETIQSQMTSADILSFTAESPSC